MNKFIKSISKKLKKIKRAIQYMLFVKIIAVDNLDEISGEICSVLENAFRSAMEKDGFAFSHYSDFSDNLAKVIESGGKIFVAYYKKKIVGTIAMKPVEEKRWYLEGEAIELCHLGVLPEYQKTGLGAKLVSIIEEETKALGLPIVLSTPEKNVNAIGFYESRGYSRARMFKATDHYAVRLVKWLAAPPFTKQEIRDEYEKTALLCLMKNYEMCNEVADDSVRKKWRREFYKYIKDCTPEEQKKMRKRFRDKGTTPKQYIRRQERKLAKAQAEAAQNKDE